MCREYMSTTPSIHSILEHAAAAPTALRRLLVASDELKTTRALLMALKGDEETTECFLRLSRQVLPGRRLLAASEAVPLLGETKSMRLALLAAGSLWLKALAGNSGLFPPLLRHSLASAIAAEPLGRESGIVDPIHAYSLGLLHHLCDAACLAFSSDRWLDEEECGLVGSELLCGVDAPASLIAAVRDYAILRDSADDPVSIETSILGTADLFATRIGYAMPERCQQPRPHRFMANVAALNGSADRLAASIEELASAVLDERGVRATRSAMHELPQIVMPDLISQASTRDLGPLPALFSRVASATDEESLAVAFTAGIVEELGASRAYCLRIDDGMLRRAVLTCHGNVPMSLPELEFAIPSLSEALQSALRCGRPLFHGVRGSGLEKLHSSLDATAYFVPIVGGKEVVGLLGLEHHDPRQVSPDLLAAVTSHAGLALRTVELKRQSEAAKIDELTGLFNRRGILEALERQLQLPDLGERGLAVALIDCDHLKKVNDNFGHLYGDEYLRRISEVVRLALRSNDLLGRYGGDEFLAILPGTQLEQAQQIFDRTRERVELAGLESTDGLLLSVSIGVVVRGGSDANRERLLKLADTALYQVKQEGRNAVRVLDAEKAPKLTM